MDKFFSILDLAVSQISHSFCCSRFYHKSGAGLRENSAGGLGNKTGGKPSVLKSIAFFKTFLGSGTPNGVFVFIITTQ